MPESPDLSEIPFPVFPERIARHLNKIGQRRGKALLKIRPLLDFVLREGEKTRPDEKTYKMLYGLISEKCRWRWREQVIAEWALGKADLLEEQSKEVAEELADQLDFGGKAISPQFARGGEDEMNLAACWAMLCLNVAMVFYGASYLFTQIHLTPIAGLFHALCFGAGSLLVLTPVVPLIVLWWRLKINKEVRQEAARSLGSLGRAEGVPALLRASQNTDFLTSVAKQALERTLPSLTYEEHYGTLGSDVVPNLCWLLKGSFSRVDASMAEWRLLLLGALEQVGDTRVIDLLKRLIKKEAAQRNDSPAVRDRALIVIAVLEARAIRAIEQRTLLRGADAPVEPRTLLRSYDKPIETPPEQLLRAMPNEDE